ncbi:MAG: energy-coupling factor transporter ATPase [Erysipelotrichaceae bacterium]|nr:energy-coupling factor transporter ATPase [Erysipelotrichaceae bacterium]
MKAIEVKNLTFSYDDTKDVLKDISFSIEEGTYTTIVGHNGSGKSTVAKLLAGLLEKKNGEIKLGGLELNTENLNKIRSMIGIVFQNPDNQFIGSTVRDDIAFGLENHCVPQAEMDEIINVNAAKVKMTKYLDHEPTRLSGGQKQRVAIAGVLAMKPKILIFDEATSMLDPQGKDEIKKVIRQLHEESSLTILSITHDIDEVASSDHVIAMNNGTIALSGTPHEVFRDERKLKELQLDVPFALKFKNALKRKGIETGEHITMEGLVKDLCRSDSNM